MPNTRNDFIEFSCIPYTSCSGRVRELNFRMKHRIVQWTAWTRECTLRKFSNLILALRLCVFDFMENFPVELTTCKRDKSKNKRTQHDILMPHNRIVTKFPLKRHYWFECVIKFMFSLHSAQAHTRNMMR